MTSESADRSERERSRRSHRRETWWQALTPGGRITVAVVGGLLAAVVVFGGGDLIATAGRINPGVRIGDVAVGMMTPADAAA